MAAGELLAWLASLPPGSRDAAIEAYLGIDVEAATDAPGIDLVGYHASSVAAIVRALVEAPVTAADTLVDLGAGLGKVVLLARLLTGATARGIELQPVLVARARAAAAALGQPVELLEGDARDAFLDDGTVFFLYAPFTGQALCDVLRRVQRVAQGRAIVVCALGVDLERCAPWLVPRPSEAFWLTIYDSVIPGTRARRPALTSALGPLAEAIMNERVHDARIDRP